jgi:hypothetical protein
MKSRIEEMKMLENRNGAMAKIIINGVEKAYGGKAAGEA